MDPVTSLIVAVILASLTSELILWVGRTWPDPYPPSRTRGRMDIHHSRDVKRAAQQPVKVTAVQ